MKLSFVVPCYNETEVLTETTRQLTEVIDRLIEKEKIAEESLICYVDDGSRDGTWELIEELRRKNNKVTGIKLAHNVGHQRALLAGLLNTEGDALISIDADLQDDINVIETMVDEFRKGQEIVFAARKQRETDTVFKRVTAESYYKFLRAMGVEIISNHADFRLMGRRAIESLRQYKETNLFLRGIVPSIGFSSTVVYYNRLKRFAGESKYPLRHMLSLALDGITSFSVTPLRMITAIGTVVFIFSVIFGAYTLFNALFTNNTVPGWASTVLPIYFIGGVQILCIGIIGEYLGKIYKETKERPRFIIEKTLDKLGNSVYRNATEQHS